MNTHSVAVSLPSLSSTAWARLNPAVARKALVHRATRLCMRSFSFLPLRAGEIAFVVRPKRFRRRIPNDRIQPRDDVHAPADFLAAGERGADADEAADRRENCQHHQRHPHRLWRFVRRVRMVLMFALDVIVAVRLLLIVSAIAAPERHRDQTRHVERRARRGDRADDPQQPSNRHLQTLKRCAREFRLSTRSR